MTTDPTTDRPRALHLLEAADFLRDAHFRDGLSVQEIGTALRHMADEADPMVGSLARDGFGLDEIAAMPAAPVAAPPTGQADEPVRCPLCADARELATPAEAREHFTTVHPEQPLVGPGPWPMLGTPPADRAGLRERIAEALIAWTYRGKDPEHGGILETVRANAYSRADAVLSVLPATSEPHRLALSTALGLGTSAPWDAIRVRAAELAIEADRLRNQVAEAEERAEADDRVMDALNRTIRELRDETGKAQQPSPRCTCGETACESELCDCDSVTCLVDHADEARQRRVTETLAAGTPGPETQPVRHAPGTVILCPDCRAKGYSVCMAGGEQQTETQGGPQFVRVCTACPVCDHTVDENGACENGCRPPAVVHPPTLLGAAELEEKLDLDVTPLTGDALTGGETQGAPEEWCKCPSCWGWFVEEHPGEDLDELGRDLGWWSGLPEHRDAPAGATLPGKDPS